MDRTEEDMKLVGLFGIFNQSFKTIFSQIKIFTQITLTLILPLTAIFLAHMEISNRFFSRIETSYLVYTSTYGNITASDWLYYWLFKILYFTFLTVFSFLSTAAVVFTIACIYTDRDVVFRKLITVVVPNVWKKLCITFVYIYLWLFIYNLLSGVVLYISRSIFGYSVIGSVILFILLILYILGFLYLTIVWQLASVVTLLENNHGFKAMKKGKMLANGKKKVGMAIAFVLYGVLLGLILVYELFVEYGDLNSGLAMIWRVMIGMLCGIMLMKVLLLFIVTQTMLYLVCKSHHREAIDKLSLSVFLSAYTAETVELPKTGEEIQLGRAQPPAAAAEMA